MTTIICRIIIPFFKKRYQYKQSLFPRNKNTDIVTQSDKYLNNYHNSQENITSKHQDLFPKGDTL